MASKKFLLLSIKYRFSYRKRYLMPSYPSF